jgi:hypothetical protein
MSQPQEHQQSSTEPSSADYHQQHDRRFEDIQQSSSSTATTTTATTTTTSSRKTSSWIKESWFEISPELNKMSQDQQQQISIKTSDTDEHDSQCSPPTTTGDTTRNSTTSTTSSTTKPARTPFLMKLHNALNDTALEKGLERIVSWHPDENGFRVHDPILFAKTVMPKYFGTQSKYQSFQRQLNLYGFKRKLEGKDIGYYRHELFQRAKPELCQTMRVQKIKGGHTTKSEHGAPSSSSRDSSSQAVVRTLERSFSDSLVLVPKQEDGRRSHASTTIIPTPRPGKRASSSLGDLDAAAAVSTTNNVLNAFSFSSSVSPSRAPKRSKSDDLAVFSGRSFYPVDDRDLRGAIL